tara:strand:+ start:71 stop:391 length:321 start_codon:yes stop_codon:yes gene_type:complete
LHHITKLIALSNKSTKSEDFYSRFKDQLVESQDWPGIYIFKFIVKHKSEEYDQLKKYLNNYEGKKSLKSSSNNKFLSLTFEYFADSPADVIKIYKGVENIDNIISL